MHIPVLLKESIDGLDIKSGDIVVDGTLGGGGHTAEVIKRFGSDVKLICFDLDSDAIDRAKAKMGDMPRDVTFRTTGFQNMDKVLKELNIAHVDGILLDLGISSYQLDVSGRGFSFLRDEPLLMTMKKNPTNDDTTAYTIANFWDEETIADIIYGFGEEKHARKIAKAIVEARSEKPIETTFDLVSIIESAVGKFYKGLRIHPATRTFQAFRIATNTELSSLEQALEKGFNLLAPRGRMAVITFHSLEDRIVKHKFLEIKRNGYGNIITKKPIIPSDDEISANPRARSSKLRIIEKI